MPSNLKQIVNKWFKSKYRPSWRDFLFLPFLLLSIIFWLSTKLSDNLQYNKDIYVVYQTPDDIVLKDDFPTILTARLQGTGWDLVFLKNFKKDQPFRFIIPANKQYINKSEIITQLNVSLGNQKIEVLDIDFANQVVHLEEKITRTLPVLFNGELNFEPFYKLLEPVSFLPDSISITGPESEVSTLIHYPIIFQKIEDIKKDITKVVQMEIPSEKYFEIVPLEVTMNIKTEQLTQKSLKIPIKVANMDDRNISIVPHEIEISFLIGLSEFSLISPEDFIAQIIIPEAVFAHQQYAVSIVKKPTNAILQEITPAYVDVFFDN